MTGCQRRPKQEKEIKIMNKPNINKRSLVIMLCVVAFFTMGSVPSASATTPTPVTITAVFDFSTFPDVTGTFTTTGALTISGPATMHVGLINPSGLVAHCVVTLIAPNGTIIIHQECQFDTSPPKGRWEIASVTGAYSS